MNDTTDATRSLQVLGRLQLACTQDSPASLKAAHMELSCTGRLRAATERGVVIEIPNPPAINLQGTMASVEFSVGHGTVNFVSEIIDVVDRTEPEVPDRVIDVELALPSELRNENRRAAVRVPVPQGSVDASIVKGPARGEVQAVDMSLLGMLIEVEPNLASALNPGDAVSVRLSVGGIQILVNAEIRRRDGRRFGLLFKTDGGPPKKMSKIMWRIQEARLLAR